ncbi:hypothetical protein QWJ07_22010 [Frankia sp. RB7]|nr:hypothetical protein [Frankia sp. RB7]
MPTRSKADLVYGIGHIAKKPKIAEALGRCIMAWSYVDWQMAVLLAALMKADSEASIAIFLTLRNARAQRDVLVAAAEMTLTGDDRDTFDAIMSVYTSLQSQRADLAHGIFGSIPDGRDDEVPWIETKNLSKDWVERFHNSKKADKIDQQDEKLAQKRSTFIYTLADLERFETEITQLWGVAFAFTLFLKYPNLPMNADELKKRCTASPLIVHALKQVTKPKE